MSDNTEQTETPKTRSEYLQGKTELSDVDIINILDLPVEKRSINNEIYTDKSYKELRNNPEELSSLTENLKTKPEYLKYHRSYIAKSKLLYQESDVLCNEIPCLIVLDQLKKTSYLLPYEYAANKSGAAITSADALKSNTFTDFKRVFNSRLKKLIEKGIAQGKDIFFLINNKKLSHDEIKSQLIRFSNNRTSENKEGTFLFFSEKDYICHAFESDKNGFITELPEYDLKEIRAAISSKPLTPSRESEKTSDSLASNLNITQENSDVNDLKQIRLANVDKPLHPTRSQTEMSATSSDNINLPQNKRAVKEVFQSLLLRGEITLLERKKDIENRNERYFDAVTSLEKLTPFIQSDSIKESNNKFVKKQKESRFYKDVQNLFVKTKTSNQLQEKKMENTSSENISYENEEMSKAAAIKERNQQKKLTTQMILDQEDKEQMENISATMKSATKDFMDLNATPITEERIDFLKTPTGNKSELSENEWKFSHSSEFKELYGDWEGKIKKDFLLNDDTVSKLTGDEFSRKEGFTLTEQVEQYFNEMNNSVESPFFGKVVLDREGADDSLSHGMGRLKAVAYAGVPNVIKNGVIIDSDLNHKDRGYNSYVIAAPIKIADKNYICEVVLKQNKQENRFYLHEVTEQKKFLERAFVTNPAQKPAHQGTLSNILEKTVSVNYEISCPMGINGEPEKTFVQNEYRKSLDEFQSKNQNTAAKTTDSVSQEENEKSTDILELQDALKVALKETSVPLEKIDFTRENYNKLFPYSKIETPIEIVKMGANQFEKLEKKERQDILLAVHDTLKNPDLIINEHRENISEKNEDNHIYAKSFLINDKVYGIQSVVVSIDGENVSISTHERNINNIVNKIKKPDQLLFAAAKVRLSVERITGEQLVTVNPIRENEYVVSPQSNIQQNSDSVKQEENPFKNADPDQTKELYEQAEAVEKMQQEAAENAVLDENGNTHYQTDEELLQEYKQKYPESSLSISEDTRNELENVFSQIDDYLDKGIVPQERRFTLPKVPSYLKELGSDETSISLPVSVIKKARETHGLSNEEIKNSLTRLYDPVAVFDTDKTKSENKVDSKLVLTDEFSESKPIALALNTNTQIQVEEDGHRKLIEVQDIRSIHDRTLTAKNGTDLVKHWTENGLCRYVDDKKISEWSTVARVSFPIEALHSDKNNILTKSEVVNPHNSDSVKQEENPSVQMEPRLMKKFDEMKKAIENREKQEGQTTAEKTESAGSKKAESHEKPKVDLIKKAAKDFINAIKNGTAPFLNTTENDFGKILLHPAAIVNASNGLPFSGEAQLLAQIYHQQQKMEGEIVTTFEGAKESGTFIADKPESKKNFVLANKTEQQQKEIIQKTRYFMPEACSEPDKIYAHALQMQRPQKISDYRDLIRHFENIPNGQKEISDLRIRIAHEHLKEIQSRFALKEKRILTVDEINERKKILQDYFKSLPEKHRESEKSAFENTFGLTLNPEEVFKTNLEGNFKNKKFEDVVKSNEKLTDQANRRLSAFIQNNSMEDKKLSEILHEEYNEQLKEEKSTSKKLKIEAKGITEPETYLGKYLAACSSNAEFVTDEDTIKAVQANLVKKLEENYRLEKYGILKEIGQQAQKISNETTSKIAFDKAHSNKNIKEKNIAKEIGPVGMGN